MKVRDAMTPQPVTASPDDPIRKVAQIMSEIDSGAVPVCRGTEVLGVITDRDIVLRVVAEGGGLDTPASQVMSRPAHRCRADDDLAHAAARMAELQMRRLVVVGDDGAIVGMLSLGDVVEDLRPRVAGRVLEAISEPGDQPA